MVSHFRHISRRQFLEQLSVAGAAGFLGLHSGLTSAEPPPETTKLKLLKFPAACLAPQYIGEELLRAEGFTELQYVERLEWPKALASGELDLAQALAPQVVAAVDEGAPLVFLAGVHLGCYDLFGGDNVRTIRDLKGKTIALTEGIRGGTHLFIASLISYVGLDPARDVKFAHTTPEEAKRLFLEGKVDGFMGYPPDAQEFKTKKIGHLLVSSAVDRPWSQHYCCIMTGNRDFVRRNPVATKRALRAILKATDLCAREPERVAQFLVSQGHATRYDYTLQLMKELSYRTWRDYNHEDSVRFWSLRLHDAGIVKSSPKNIIAQGTDWRFLNELKRELKA
jgi:NitT/TauT family transport system substrate-binding protein